MVARHRGMFAVALVVLGIATVVFVTVRAGTDQDGSPSDSAADSKTARAPLSGAGEELVRLLANGIGNFDVAYEVTDPARGASDAHLWRRPPLARLDTLSGTGDGSQRESKLLTSSGPVRCTATGLGPWSCMPSPGLDLGSVGVVPPRLVEQLSRFDITVRDGEILDESVRCFTLSPASGAPGSPGEGAAEPSELCVTPDGIPARVAAGAARLELVALERGRVPDSVFEPPAPVGG